MNNELIMSVLKCQHVSEKATIIAEKHGQIAFKVTPTATKPQIKKAVEQLFNVKVKNVSVIGVKGKVKKFRNKIGKRKDWKKAYVSLHSGHDINFTGIE